MNAGQHSSVDYALHTARTRLRDLIEQTPGDDPRRDELSDVLIRLNEVIHHLQRIRIK